MVDVTMRRRRERLPRPLRIAVEWAVTVGAALVIVVALEAWVVTPFRIPTSSMEPTLHCARPGQGCEARFSDRVLACKACYWFSSPARGDVVVFHAPKNACGIGGTFVKRLIGLPGETVSERDGIVSIDGKRLSEPYVQPARRDRQTGTWPVPAGHYFFMGDNRSMSCDSRVWGSVPRSSIIGKAILTYWPPNRIGVP
jgi:signal peptidase I